MLARSPANSRTWPGLDDKDLSEEAKVSLFRKMSTQRERCASCAYWNVGNSQARLLSNKADYQHKTYEERSFAYAVFYWFSSSTSACDRRVLELLNLLKYHRNKVAAIKSFEDYFFQTRPRTSHSRVCVCVCVCVCE